MAVYVKTRTAATKHPRTKRFERYYVFYRRGGRGWPEKYGGGFPTLKEAHLRRDLIAGELAAGRDPEDLLLKLRTPQPSRARLEQLWDTWMRSRKDVGASAQALYGNSRDRWLPILKNADPARISVETVIAGVDELLDDLSPHTVRLYLSHLAMVLDYGDVAPNPARSRKIKLPTHSKTEKVPPSNDEWAHIIRTVAQRSRLALSLMECCGLRVSEACGLEAGDLDLASGQILVRRAVTKTRAGRRWIPCPPSILEGLQARKGVGVTPGQIYYDLAQVCDHGTHAFRRRRISLWLRQQIDPVQVSRWAGHSRASEGLDVYGFTMVDAFQDEWLSFWLKAYGGAKEAVEA